MIRPLPTYNAWCVKAINPATPRTRRWSPGCSVHMITSGWLFTHMTLSSIISCRFLAALPRCPPLSPSSPFATPANVIPSACPTTSGRNGSNWSSDHLANRCRSCACTSDRSGAPPMNGESLLVKGSALRGKLRGGTAKLAPSSVEPCSVDGIESCPRFSAEFSRGRPTKSAGCTALSELLANARSPGGSVGIPSMGLTSPGCCTATPSIGLTSLGCCSMSVESGTGGRTIGTDWKPVEVAAESLFEIPLKMPSSLPCSGLQAALVGKCIETQKRSGMSHG
mmetsp:Transcript_12503/g.24905  ORF Transcript_12503/g.24905 Transcript_12503/m.24905 type:complete len:281 (-) Transcript_12503:239-1081(-)